MDLGVFLDDIRQLRDSNGSHVVDNGVSTNEQCELSKRRHKKWKQQRKILSVKIHSSLGQN